MAAGGCHSVQKYNRIAYFQLFHKKCLRSFYTKAREPYLARKARRSRKLTTLGMLYDDDVVSCLSSLEASVLQDYSDHGLDYSSLDYSQDGGMGGEGFFIQPEASRSWTISHT